MKRLIVLLIFLQVAVLHAAGRWQLIGPSAGTVQRLLPDRNDPGVVFAILDSSLYRSADQGGHWQKLPIPDANFVTIAAKTGQVFVLSYPFDNFSRSSTLWVSNDAGLKFLVQAVFPFQLRSIFVHPQTVDFMIGIGVNNVDLAKSIDGGRHWKVLIVPSVEDYELIFSDVAFSPFDPGTIYATGVKATDHFGDLPFRYVSRDLARTWQPMGKREYAFDADPAFPARVFAASCQGIETLTSRGWEQISHRPLTQIASVPDHPLVLYGIDHCALTAERSSGTTVWKSTDAGKSWNSFPFQLENGASALAATADVVFAGTNGGGLFAKQGEQTWKSSRNGIHDADIVQVATGGTGAFVYAVSPEFSLSPFLSRFIFRRNSAGGGWSNLFVHTDPSEGMPLVGSISVNPLDARRVLAQVTMNGASFDTILASADAGRTWTVALGNLDSNSGSISYDPNHPDTVYLTNYSRVFKSSDGGRSFQLLALDFTCCRSESRVVVDPHDPQSLYFLFSFYGVYKSIDGGASAQKLSCGGPCNRAADLAPLPAAGAFLLLTQQGTILKTTDGGAAWRKISQVAHYSYFVEHKRLYAADNRGKHFFAVFASEFSPAGDLYESLDGGTSWKKINSQFGDSVQVKSITDPRHRPYYVATSLGVFQATDWRRG